MEKVIAHFIKSCISFPLGINIRLYMYMGAINSDNRCNSIIRFNIGTYMSVSPIPMNI